MSKKSQVVFISYYTDNYKHYADGLIRDFERFGLTYDVERIEDKGGWYANVRFKPVFIRNMLRKHKTAKAVVWIDADASVKRVPKLLFELDADLAVYHLYWPRKKDKELLSGTVYVGNTVKGRRMMDRWIAALEEIWRTTNKPKERFPKPEQQILQRLLPKLDIEFYDLPHTYCQIANFSCPSHSPIVIEHRQASRQWRWGPGGRPRVIRTRKQERLRRRALAARRIKPHPNKPKEKPKQTGYTPVRTTFAV